MSMQPILSIPTKKIRAVEEMLASEETQAIRDLADPTGFSLDEDVAAALIEYGLKRFPERRDKQLSGLDAFMAPRLHMLLRLSRNMAAVPGVWTWLAADPFKPYMRHRWPLEKSTTLWRYTSRNVLRNGVSRLWWAAEMLRDGADYTLVPLALHSVRRFQFVSELRYSRHRECARAFTRVLAESDASDEQAQELSKRFNVYLKARALEYWDYDDDAAQASFDKEWGARTPTLLELTVPEPELAGPADARSRSDVEEHLYGWLRDVASEA